MRPKTVHHAQTKLSKPLGVGFLFPKPEVQCLMIDDNKMRIIEVMMEAKLVGGFITQQALIQLVQVCTVNL
jgi:hypothetical protein